MTNPNQLVTVREIEEQDYDQWAIYWKKYQNFYQVDLALEITKETFKRFFMQNEPIFGAVAVFNDNIVGFVHSVIHRSTWAVQDFCYLEDLYVDEISRGQGTGKLLIEYVQNFARENNCARLYWHTQESNKQAQKLYDWVAFKPEVIEYRMSL